MYAFKSFVYLDAPKTGSSFICSILRKFIAEEEEQKEPHVPFKGTYSSDKFHFISVRNPLDQYISLYSFGCESKGALFACLHSQQLEGLYDGTWKGFLGWLDFVLDPQNARYIPAHYKKLGKLRRIVGYQSSRVLCLAMRDGGRSLAECETREDVTAAYAAARIPDYVVRYESLRADMENLLCTRLRDSVSDMDAALAFIRENRARNSSNRVDRFEQNPGLGKRREAFLWEREWPMQAFFGYQPVQKGIGNPVTVACV